MLLSEFVNILYKYNNEGRKKGDYLVFLFDTLIKTPTDGQNVDSHNPFSVLEQDTLERIFNGKNRAAKANALKVRGLADVHKFAEYINNINWDSQMAIAKDFSEKVDGYNFDNDLGEECANLFLKILDEIYDGTSHSCEKSPKPQRLTKSQKESAKTVKPLYKSDRLYQETEKMIQQGSESIINLNDGQGLFSLKATPNTIYQFRTDYQFETKIAPDRTRQTVISFNYEGVRFSGFTTAKNWESQSTMNNIVSAGKHLCTAWFYFVSLDASRAVVQFLMIGEDND